MITYTKDELISATELAKNLSKFLNSIKTHRREKIAIIHNDRPEAVMMSIDEYERLREAYELLEYLEIYQLVEAREQTPHAEYLSHEEMLKLLETD